jgi:hypothetical protein
MSSTIWQNMAPWSAYRGACLSPCWFKTRVTRAGAARWCRRARFERVRRAWNTADGRSAILLCLRFTLVRLLRVRLPAGVFMISAGCGYTPVAGAGA